MNEHPVFLERGFYYIPYEEGGSGDRSRTYRLTSSKSSRMNQLYAIGMVSLIVDFIDADGSFQSIATGQYRSCDNKEQDCTETMVLKLIQDFRPPDNCNDAPEYNQTCANARRRKETNKILNR